jgi:hypothetical protein
MNKERAESTLPAMLLNLTALQLISLFWKDDPGLEGFRFFKWHVAVGDDHYHISGHSSSGRRTI